MFNINEFLSNINKYGIAKAENFSVLISRPNGNLGDERDMTFRADSCEIPGIEVGVYESKYHGLPYKMATEPTLADIPITFILSEDLREKLYFQNWIDSIYGDIRRSKNSPTMYNLKYYKEYIGTVDITLYN